MTVPSCSRFLCPAAKALTLSPFQNINHPENADTEQGTAGASTGGTDAALLGPQGVAAAGSCDRSPPGQSFLTVRPAPSGAAEKEAQEEAGLQPQEGQSLRKAK